VITLIKQSSSVQPLEFLLVSSSDGNSPVTGATPAVTLSKCGGSFAAPAGAVSEIGSGWYKVAPNATDSNTLGPLILHATASGAYNVDVAFSVVGYDPQSATNLGLSQIDTNVGSRAAPGAQMDLVNAPNSTAIAAIQNGLAAAANLATANTNIAAIESQANKIGTNSGDSPAQQAAQATISGNLDTTVSSRLAASAYAAPPTVSQLAAGVLKTPANLLATDSSGNVAANNLPTDYQQRGVAVTLPTPAPTGYGSTGGSGGGSGSGTGPIAINQNTGGTDNLRYVDSTGNGVEGASIIIYLATDWPGNPTNAQATSTTGPDGRWLAPAFVNHGTYVAVFTKVQADGPDVSGAFTV
jgi:hypothetical protein